MTYLERPTQSIQLMPLFLALAMATAFALGIVLGGPVLQLGVTAPARDVTITEATRATGQAWEAQRRQQTPTYSLVDSRTLRSGAAWEAERRAQAPRSR